MFIIHELLLQSHLQVEQDEQAEVDYELLDPLELQVQYDNQ